MFGEIDALSALLALGIPVPDATVETTLRNFKVGPTNTFNTARILMRAAASIVPYREKFADMCLDEILYPLMASGIDTPDRFFEWIDFELGQRDPFGPGGIRDKFRLDWVRGLRNQPERIQRLMDVIEIELDQDLTDEIREWLEPYNSLPADRVRFRATWAARHIAQVSPGIMWFSTRWEKDDDAASGGLFRSLTEIVRDNDPGKKLKVFAYDWEAYDAVDETTLPPIDGEVSARSQCHLYPAHIVWVANGEVIHNMLVPLDGVDILTEFTREILRRI